MRNKQEATAAFLMIMIYIPYIRHGIEYVAHFKEMMNCLFIFLFFSKGITLFSKRPLLATCPSTYVSGMDMTNWSSVVSKHHSNSCSLVYHALYCYWVFGKKKTDIQFVVEWKWFSSKCASLSMEVCYSGRQPLQIHLRKAQCLSHSHTHTRTEWSA